MKLVVTGWSAILSAGLVASCGGKAVGPTTGGEAEPAAPATVLASLVSGGDADRICFARAPATGAVMCDVGWHSIQGGAERHVRVLGPGAAAFPYYRHPEGEQYFEPDPARLDQDMLRRVGDVATAGGFEGWGGRDMKLAAGNTVTIDRHQLRRTRTETGTDGDPTTGVWPISTDTVELRCGERWVALTLTGDVFGHPVGEPELAVVALGDQVLLTGRVSWGVEGDQGGGHDAALIDVAEVCRAEPGS